MQRPGVFLLFEKKASHATEKDDNLQTSSSETRKLEISRFSLIKGNLMDLELQKYQFIRKYRNI